VHFWVWEEMGTFRNCDIFGCEIKVIFWCVGGKLVFCCGRKVRCFRHCEKSVIF